ncbi:MAG: chemotaxis protein CheX [Campylobacterales bacterium]
MLKPVLKDRVAYFVLDEEHYDKQRAKKDALDLKKLATTLKGLDIKAILLSLKNVPDLDNDSLIPFFTVLHEFEKSLDVIAGICDYKARVYSQSLNSAKKYHVSLFKNSDIARFILKITTIPADKTVCFLMENELDFELFKDEIESRGVVFQGFSNSGDFDTYASKNECFKVSKTYVDFLHNKTVMRLEGGVVYFDLQDRLGKKIETLFPLHAFYKKAKEGFRLFVLEGSQVEFIDPKAIDFFISLSINSMKYGAKIVFLKFPPNLINRSVQQTLQKAHIKYFDTKQKMQSDPEIAQLLNNPVKTKGGGLSKALVSNLPLFIDATVDTFSSFVGSSATKKSHTISEYSDDFLDDNYAGSSIEYSGMINATLVLVFSYSLIDEVSEVLLGEACANDEERVDVLSEFLNIISGQSKTMLSKKDINVSISLPKTFVSKNDFIKYISGKKGILINFEFDAKPLQLFLAP